MENGDLSAGKAQRAVDYTLRLAGGVAWVPLQAQYNLGLGNRTPF